MCFLIVHKKIKSPETVEFQGFSFGGDKRDRTADLLNAIQALSQLSYTPMGKMYIIRHAAKCQEFFHAFRKSLKIILCGWV